jgi:hypothetical protein
MILSDSKLQEIRNQLLPLKLRTVIDIRTLEQEPDLTNMDDVHQIINEYVSTLGFNQITVWQEVAKHHAIIFLTEVIAFNLAYKVRVMPDEDASKLAAIFLGFFDEKSLYFTNMLPQSIHTRKLWSRLSENTFDTGLVAVSKTKIGILWIMDED